MSKKIITLFLLSVLTVSSIAGCGNSKSTDNNDDTKAKTEAVSENNSTDSETSTPVSETTKDLLSGKHHVEIEVKDYGTISVELDADTAPITVTNFVNLAKEGFYDNLTFMRVMSNFMIQGGDPNKDCTGGSENTIKGEFTANGVDNKISHVRGTISMARSMDNDSASSQFFICNADATQLDGQYAGFGSVTNGMEVVDKITEDFASYSGVITDVEKQPVIKTIKVID